MIASRLPKRRELMSSSRAERSSASYCHRRAALIMPSLVRIYRKQGRPAEAHDLLVPLYSWFAEDFDTPPLKEAKALLDEISGG